MKKITLLFIFLLMMSGVSYSQQETVTIRMYYTVMESTFDAMGMDIVQIHNPPIAVVEYRDFILDLTQRHYSEEEFVMYQLTTSSEMTFVVILIRDGTQWFSRYYIANVTDSLLERFF